VYSKETKTIVKITDFWRLPVFVVATKQRSNQIATGIITLSGSRPDVILRTVTFRLTSRVVGRQPMYTPCRIDHRQCAAILRRRCDVFGDRWRMKRICFISYTSHRYNIIIYVLLLLLLLLLTADDQRRAESRLGDNIVWFENRKSVYTYNHSGSIDRNDYHVPACLQWPIGLLIKRRRIPFCNSADNIISRYLWCAHLTPHPI